MGNGIYVAMNGASARQQELDRIADALANVETPGYRAARTRFSAVWARRGSLAQAHVAASGTAVDTRPGRIEQTDRPLDLTLPEDAYLVVRRPDGGVALTRDGRLTVGAGGRLETAGRPVLNIDGEEIRVPLGLPAHVDPEGRVLAGGEVVATLDRRVSTGPLDRIGPALLVPAQAASLAADRRPLTVGAVELGPQSPVTALVELITAQRSFEGALRAIEAYRAIDGKAVQIATFT